MKKKFLIILLSLQLFQSAHIVSSEHTNKSATWIKVPDSGIRLYKPDNTPFSQGNCDLCYAVFPQQFSQKLKNAGINENIIGLIGMSVGIPAQKSGDHIKLLNEENQKYRLPGGKLVKHPNSGIHLKGRAGRPKAWRTPKERPTGPIEEKALVPTSEQQKAATPWPPSPSASQPIAGPKSENETPPNSPCGTPWWQNVGIEYCALAAIQVTGQKKLQSMFERHPLFFHQLTSRLPLSLDEKEASIVLSKFVTLTGKNYYYFRTNSFEKKVAQSALDLLIGYSEAKISTAIFAQLETSPNNKNQESWQRELAKTGIDASIAAIGFIARDWIGDPLKTVADFLNNG